MVLLKYTGGFDHTWTCKNYCNIIEQ